MRMQTRTIIIALFSGSAALSPVANAYWFFQERAASVVELVPPPQRPLAQQRHYRYHSHYHHPHRHKRAFQRRGIFASKGNHHVSHPLSAVGHQISVKRTKLKARHPIRVTVLKPTSKPAHHRSTAKVLSAHAKAAMQRLATGRVPLRKKGAHLPDHGRRDVKMLGRISAFTAPGNGASYPKKATVRKPPVVVAPVITRMQINRANLTATLPSKVSKSPGFPSSARLVSSPGSNDRSRRRVPPYIRPLTATGTFILAAAMRYVIFRRRKSRSISGLAVDGESSAPNTRTKPERHVSDSQVARPMVAVKYQRLNFNYDEVRRLDVNEFFLGLPVVPIRDPNTAASAREMYTNGLAARAVPMGEEGTPIPDEWHLVPHDCGEIVVGRVTELYATPDEKAGLAGFYEHIPAQFQDPAWAKISYNDGQNYTFAMVASGILPRLGDSVNLMFGQQTPPVPNQILTALDR